jgi:two-component system LytT family response regulator
MNIRTLIVDDEDIARQGLRKRLQRTDDFEIVGECADWVEAQGAIRELTPDVIFLDIRMPELSGFDLTEKLPKWSPPRVIFVTAYEEYAVRAFEVHALDYLLKPIDDNRVNETLARVRSALVEGTENGYARHFVEALTRISSGSGASAQSKGSDRIAIPQDDRVTILKVSEIDWVEASGNYVSLHTGKKTWLLRETITSMDGRLASFGFVRIHRSTLVNIERVTELRTLENGDLSVSLNDGTVLRLSRNYREALDVIVGRRST